MNFRPSLESVVVSIVAPIIAIFTITSCTVNLPPSDEPIPSADPILLPEKNTTPSAEANNKAETKKTTSPAASSSPASTSDIATKTTKPKSEPSRERQVFYVVKAKDTVFEVMRKTGVHWTEIIRLNDLKAPKYTIYPGQNLRIK